MTSLCGQFTTFGKVVICAMMIRGRHRGLPYAIDRAIMLPSERRGENEGSGEEPTPAAREPGNKKSMLAIKRFNTN